jgi:hypothetical protein
MISKRIVLRCDGCAESFGMREGDTERAERDLREKAREVGWAFSGAVDRCPRCEGLRKARSRK